MKTGEEYRELVWSVLNGEPRVEFWPGRKILYVHLTKSLTYAKLNSLSEILGTDRINILPHKEGRYCESGTIESPTAARLEIFL